MAYIRKILDRPNLQALREHLLYGVCIDEYDPEDYETRLKAAHLDCMNVVKKYDSREESELFLAINNMMSEYEHVYMELGIQTGFALAKDIVDNIKLQPHTPE